MALNPCCDWRRHVYYWGLPSLAAATLIGMYFSGVDLLRNIVAPDRLGREFGALENIQHLLLLAIVAIALHACWRTRERSARLVFAAAFLFLLFIFLEEIDYGLHYWNWASAIWAEGPTVRNLHNQDIPFDGEITKRMKQLMDVGMILFFVVLPLAAAKSDNAWVRYFLPSRLFVVTLICSFVLSKTAHGLDNQGLAEGGALHSNISEFRELFVYYIGFVYFVDLIYRRSWPRPGRGSSENIRESAVVGERDSRSRAARVLDPKK